jgi:hypothetical protein
MPEFGLNIDHLAALHESLPLLHHRDEVWKNEVRGKIKDGMDSIRAGCTISAEQVKIEMTAFKKRQARNRCEE